MSTYDDTEPGTPLTKLVERSLDKVLDRRLPELEASIAARVVNALGAWRYKIERELEDHARRLEHLEHVLRTRDTLPPSAPDTIPPSEG